MKKRRIVPKSQDLIKLIDRKKDKNKEMQNQQNTNIKQIKLEEVKQNKYENNKEANNKSINGNINNNFNTIINNNHHIVNLYNNNKLVKENKNRNNNNISKPKIMEMNNIITMLRVRPESEKEIKYSNIDIIKIENTTSMKLVSPTEYNFFINGTKYLKEEKGLEVTDTKEYNYNFDYIFDQKSEQNEVYQNSTSFLVKNIFEGFNSTILAYGSTGSGKTYTMFGNEDNPGIIFRTINQILNNMEDNGINLLYDLQISFIEIYNESIYDLLTGEDKTNTKKEK